MLTTTFHWAKGYGLPNHEREGVTTPPIFRLRAVIGYLGVEQLETHTTDFPPYTEEWQFASIQ